MSLLGKKFPGALAKPMTPFFAAGLIVLYGVNSLQNALINTAEFKNDPRNPNAKVGGDAKPDLDYPHLFAIRLPTTTFLPSFKSNSTPTSEVVNMSKVASLFRPKKLDLSGFVNIRVIRDHNRRNAFEKTEPERQALRYVIRNTSLPGRVRAQAQLQLSQMEAYTRPTQIKNRCVASGTSRSVFRDFRLNRYQFRMQALSGELPGVKKASWLTSNLYTLLGAWIPYLFIKHMAFCSFTFTMLIFNNTFWFLLIFLVNTFLLYQYLFTTHLFFRCHILINFQLLYLLPLLCSYLKQLSSSMFIFKDEDLPADFTFPKDLKSLGFFINENDQIRKIDNPDEGFTYRINHNDRYNQKHREAVNGCTRQIVLDRLHNLGLTEYPIPEPDMISDDLRQNVDIPVIPILMTDNCYSAKRIVIVLGDPGQDLGIWSYRAIGEDGINAGSMVDFAKAVLGVGENRSTDIALVIANTGQLLYSWAEGKAMTQESWVAADRPYATWGQPTLTFRNKAPTSQTVAEHVAAVFIEYISKVIKIDSHSLIDVIGSDWRPYINGIALGAPLQSEYGGQFDPKLVDDLTTFTSFLARRGRSYVLHKKRIGRYIPGDWEVTGCKVYSSGEELNQECILRRAWPDIIDWLNLLHQDPKWEDDLSADAQVESDSEDSSFEFDDHWDDAWDSDLGEPAEISDSEVVPELDPVIQTA
ncbi:hypothetical protein N7495_008498 [Penicillium taxi]|uniref:uncharacterized protein n=1 Tax=Penicillium taxi TaxID=168475 RepID=UPI00254551EE|nr:uncharacterized protein N7495_008498 [Penicillium taxi]KAJ5888457.1 hypothetical protein N7495_008498 [Penicillium taxi]